jgi:hypothetical protein
VIGRPDMPPDIEPLIGLMSVILLAIGEKLRRRLKRKRLVSLVLTVKDMDESSEE